VIAVHAQREEAGRGFSQRAGFVAEGGRRVALRADGHRVLGRTEQRRGERREGEVAEAEAIAREVGASVGQALARLVEDGAHFVARQGGVPGVDAHGLAHDQAQEREGDAQEGALEGRRRVSHAPHGARAVRKQVKIGEASHVRREVDVQMALERESVVALATARRQELAVAGRAGVGPADDALGIVEHSVAVEDEDRHRAGLAAGDPDGAPMEQRNVPFFAVRDPGVIERPARLLAKMAERNGHEGRHGVGLGGFS
jgi:hypothetical protein